MLDGWYCRSMANIQAREGGSGVGEGNGANIAHPPNQHGDYSSESSREPTPEPNYKSQYTTLKKKLKYLVYENECFQDALRSSQKRLLKVSRDRSYLLDRLLQYEKPESSTSESEDTESSDDMDYRRMEQLKGRKSQTNKQPNTSQASLAHKQSNATRRKRAPVSKRNTNSGHSQTYSSKISPALAFSLSNAGDGHMTPEEVERHLQSRQSYLERLPERAPPTVPTEMFSNEPSLDSESNDVMENSPNVEEWLD